MTKHIAFILMLTFSGQSAPAPAVLRHLATVWSMVAHSPARSCWPVVKSRRRDRNGRIVRSSRPKKRHAVQFRATPASATSLYDASLHEYRRGAYDIAVVRFDEYLRLHPEHESVGLATSWRELSQIRMLLKQSAGPPLRAFEYVERLPRDSLLHENRLVRDEFKETILCLVNRFVSAAKATPVIDEKERLVEYADRALRIIIRSSYVPQ